MRHQFHTWIGHQNLTPLSMWMCRRKPVQWSDSPIINTRNWVWIECVTFFWQAVYDICMYNICYTWVMWCVIPPKFPFSVLMDGICRSKVTMCLLWRWRRKGGGANRDPSAGWWMWESNLPLHDLDLQTPSLSVSLAELLTTLLYSNLLLCFLKAWLENNNVADIKWQISINSFSLTLKVS